MNHVSQKALLSFVAIVLFLKVSGQSFDQQLRKDWQIQSSAKVLADGPEISTAAFDPLQWQITTVPHTVLGALVDNGVYKNIFYARNLEKIPDSLFIHPWWYRKTFNIPVKNASQVYRLRFDGISYRADIWLNGHKVASADTLEGSFRQFTINISPYVRSGENVLALKITRAGAGELNIGFVDWNPEPADHSMGIWRDVHLLTSGSVSLDETFVKTDVDTATLNHADITLSTVLHNYSAKALQGVLHTTIGNDVHITQSVTLAAGETKKVVLSPDQHAALSMDHPKLWWTHTLGKPNLYPLQMDFTVNGQVSDSRKMNFGIRTVSDYMTKDGFRGYRLNGKKILIKGGGWTDPMLLNATPDYEEAGIDYAVHMNLNTIRMEGFWGHDQHLYDLCDEKGILIMAGFSCQWEWKNIFGTKDDKYGGIITSEQMDVAARSWHDQITWLRNHPSIFLWLYGSDKWPRPALERQYLDILKKYDPTRPYAQSAKEQNSEITGPSGMKMRGPYDYVPPDYWYTDQKYGGAFGFNTETSPGPEVPVLESLKKMIPASSLWPADSTWLYHAARGKFHNLTAYNDAMDARLGKPKSLDDYLRKAQFLNYEGMRAMFEAFEANRFKATGIIQWMYNSSWPKLWWQFYDYYLTPTAALYGARKANEAIHISYNYKNNGIDIINNTFKNFTGLKAEIKVLNIDSKTVFEKTVSAAATGSQQTLSILQLPDNLSLSKTYFLDLRLKDKQQLVSNNFYVLSTQKDQLDEAKSTWYITPESQYADLQQLQQLPEVQLKSSGNFNTQADTTFAKIVLKNPSQSIAFMVYLDFRKKQSEQSVTPVFWDDNYITLLPGEQRTVSGYCHTKDLEGQQPEVLISGWNIQDKSTIAMMQNNQQ